MNVAIVTEMLKRHEGVRLKPYVDTVGKLTIGVGRNLDDVGISLGEAEFLLERDIDRVVADLTRAVPVWLTLDEVRQHVLVDMCFNAGITRLLGFKKAVAAVQSGDYETAAAEMLNSKWATQVGLRAKTLADMMRSGTT